MISSYFDKIDASIWLLSIPEAPAVDSWSSRLIASSSKTDISNNVFAFWFKLFASLRRLVASAVLPSPSAIFASVSRTSASALRF